MSEQRARQPRGETISEVANEPAEARGGSWRRRAILLVLAIGVLVLAYFFAASFLPRWWAHRVGDQVKGRFSGGIWWGLTYGVLCTAVPLVVVRQAFRKRWDWQRRWQTRAIVVVIALLLALPNLMTLGIVLGNGAASHAGERILDVDAPGFRGATLAGVLVAVVVCVLAQYLVTTRRRRTREVKQLRRRDKERAAADEAAARAAELAAESPDGGARDRHDQAGN
jgi:Na+/proline symporter